MEVNTDRLQWNRYWLMLVSMRYRRRWPRNFSGTMTGPDGRTLMDGQSKTGLHGSTSGRAGSRNSNKEQSKKINQ